MSRSLPSAGRVRIIGGHWKKSVLHFPQRTDLRPTPERVRETLFNWLGQRIDGLRCLDAFAGSGALGFEAASRGASAVVLLETDRVALTALQENAQRLQATQIQVVAADALRWLADANERFDVVFLDPPFRQNVLSDVLALLPRVLNPGARVHVEASAPMAVQTPWHELRHARAGQVHHQLLEFKHDRGSLSGDV